jgi:hypothetical protein
MLPQFSTIDRIQSGWHSYFKKQKIAGAKRWRDLFEDDLHNL